MHHREAPMQNNATHSHLTVGVPTSNAPGFQALMSELVEQARQEPGTLVYEWYQTDDGTWHIVERYSDAENGDLHVKGFAENYAARFFELTESCAAIVSANATPYIRGVLEGLAPLYILQKDGFNRF